MTEHICLIKLIDFIFYWLFPELIMILVYPLPNPRRRGELFLLFPPGKVKGGKIILRIVTEILKYYTADRSMFYVVVFK